MAAKKQLKVKSVPKPSSPKTISVGRPTAKIPTITVLGIEFEQGTDFKFGKCIQNNNPQRVWTYIELPTGERVQWAHHTGDGLLDALVIRNVQQRASYTDVDFDTPVQMPTPQQLAANNMPDVGGAIW